MLLSYRVPPRPMVNNACGGRPFAGMVDVCSPGRRKLDRLLHIPLTAGPQIFAGLITEV